MMWTPRKILCIIAFVAVTGIVVVYCEDFEDLFGDADYDHDDWLDPGDMFNYNPNAKKKVQSKKTAENSQEPKPGPTQPTKSPEVDKSPVVTEGPRQDAPSKEDAAHPDLHSNMVFNTDGLKQCEKSESLDLHTPYFRQFVAQLSRHFGSPWGESDDFYYEMVVKLSKEDLEKMKSFGMQDSNASMHDVHDILSDMVQNIKQIQNPDDDGILPIRLSWKDEMRAWTLITCQIAGCMAAVLVIIYILSQINLSWRRIFFCCIVAFFIVSIPWTWWRLYLDETAKRHTAVTKNLNCYKQDVSWTQAFWNFVSNSEEECAKFQRDLIVDAMWDVPPTTALAVTFSKFILEPLEHIGEGLRKFFMSSLQGIPWLMYPIMILFDATLIILFVIMFCGYRISLLHLLHLEPARGQQREAILQNQVQQLEAQVQQLMAAKTSRPSGVESVEHNHPASSSVTHSRPAAVTQSSNGESSLSLPVQESGANDASPQDTSDPLPRDSEDPDITQTSTDELSETAAPETPSSATVVNVGPSHS